MDGFINLDKPPGISSARAVDQIKRLLPRKTKIGHAGTLDPFATGVLVLLVGKATKQCERLMGQPKRYDATIKLGATTETDDPEAPEQAFEAKAPFSPAHEPDHAIAPPTRREVELVVPRFIGAIQQRPPIYSALKIAGRRAYDLARGGQTVELEARTVHVYGIELLHYVWPLLTLRIDCGRGTYIRSIARDLGEALQVGGYLTALRRTRVGDFAIDRAKTLDLLRRDGVEAHFVPLTGQPGSVG